MQPMRKRSLLVLFLALPLVCVLAALFAYNLPPIHDRLAWRVENIKVEIRHALNPPEQAVFIPQGGVGSDPAAASTIEAIVQATLSALPTATNIPSATPTQPGPTPTPEPTPTATLTPTPIPAQITLTGAKHEYQKMNNCGPTTLAMGLSYWGWDGDQILTRSYLRPNFAVVDDKNVMPAEMVDYVETQTNLKAISRVGGDIDLLKRFLAAGFPVIIEKGLQLHDDDWMGHYVLVTGYDDNRERFITQDSYVNPNVPVAYADVKERWWRDFNYQYIVIYPPEREQEMLDILGPHADPAFNYEYAVQIALEETERLSDRDLFFAWYNLGTNRVALQDYAGAAQAYDHAFINLYPNIRDKDRPWRMLWYQTGPYEAYYHTGRYADLVALGNQTLDQAGGPILEETFYWLGKAREAQGDMDKAIYDYQKAVEINPISTPARAELVRLGVLSQ